MSKNTSKPILVVAGQDQVVRYVQKPATYGVTIGFDF